MLNAAAEEEYEEEGEEGEGKRPKTEEAGLACCFLGRPLIENKLWLNGTIMFKIPLLVLLKTGTLERGSKWAYPEENSIVLLLQACAKAQVANNVV